MAAYTNLYWSSADGLKLHARDYAGERAGERPAIVCLPGVTRNARDFAALAATLVPEWRVIAVDLRGRGRSEAAKDPATYHPATYVEDVEAMLIEAGLDRVVLIGNSLGGVVAMTLAARLGEGRIAGAVLNDIGPVIEPAGLSRIRSHIGRASSFPTWLHAARCVAEANRDAHPDWGLAEWLDMAKRLYRVTSAGRIVLDYDLRLAEPFRLPGSEAGENIEAAWEALARAPVLVVRGERSDMLSAASATAMAARPGVELVTVPGLGHAPTLAEPVATAGIARLLARIGEPAAV